MAFYISVLRLLNPPEPVFFLWSLQTRALKLQYMMFFIDGNPLFIDFWCSASHVPRTFGGLLEKHLKGGEIKLCVDHQCLLYWASLSITCQTLLA